MVAAGTHPAVITAASATEVSETSTKYSLSDLQLRHLAIICDREQNGDAGIRACASQMCNYYEIWQQKKFRNIYECVFGSGWYWEKERNDKWVATHPNVSAEIIDAVRDVICNGHRTLPDYIDEYDRLEDIGVVINDGVWHTDREYIMNRSNYHKDKTIIRNQWAKDPGDQYTFYCFPDGVSGICDAFGYIKKPTGASEEVAAVASNKISAAESATRWMEALAADQTHGYSQANRWGPDYDCSSSVISAYEQAGVPVKARGATFTGNMRAVFLACGFKDVTSQVNLNTGAGLVRGDVLLYHIGGTTGHTAMYAGNGNIVHARGQSYGSAASGDQGSEIAVTAYSRSKWQYVLRYKGSVTATATVTQTVTSTTPSTTPSTASTARTTATLPEIQTGSYGSAVSVLQGLLDMMGYIGSNGKALDIDGDFGGNTAYALKAFQTAAGLTVDGVCGEKTWNKLKSGLTF